MRLLPIMTAACVLAATAPGQSSIEAAGALAPLEAVAAHVVRDLDGDGAAELLLVHDDGAVRAWRLAGESADLEPVGDAALQLPDPEYSVLALSDVLGDPRLELVVLDRRGTAAWTFDPAAGFGGAATPLAKTSPPGARLGVPAFAELVRDVNADGAGDLVVPTATACELWLRRGEDDDQPRYERTQVIPVQLSRDWGRRGRLLSSTLSSRVEIPALKTADVNGDGRPDLLAEEGRRRLFYLQETDGRFAQAPVTVDLSLFRDTTPKADADLGDTLVIDDEARMQRGDLNADGVPDYVVAHRRKLWTFLATPAGPQFTDAQVRMVAEDISGLILVHLDNDDRQDLLIFKVELPSAAELVLGFVSSIDVEVTALGYRTEPGGAFADRAQWRRDLTLRVPSVMRLMAEADDLVERFMEVIEQFRWSASGDFDGDGQDDLALFTADEAAVELWLRPKADADVDRAGARWFRTLLFENPDPIFDVERALKLAAQVFDLRTAALTGDRQPNAVAPLPPRPGRYLIDLLAADLDGDGRAELIAVDDDKDAPGARRYQVLRWGDRPSAPPDRR